MSVKIAEKITQMNNQDYALMDASAIEYTDSNGNKTRVDKVLDNIPESSSGNTGGIYKPGINQITTLAVTNGQIITIDGTSLNTTKLFVQVYKFIAGNTDLTEVIKVFDNANETNFIHSNDVEFDSECHIKNSYNYESSLNSTSNFYETEEINVSEFLELNGINGGE